MSQADSEPRPWGDGSGGPRLPSTKRFGDYELQRALLPDTEGGARELLGNVSQLPCFSLGWTGALAQSTLTGFEGHYQIKSF